MVDGRLTYEEHLEYVTAIWDAAKGFKAARGAMAWVIARIEKSARER
jgi:hypothetical protein